MTGIVHSARISTVKVIVSSDKWIRMVNFKLGKEMRKVNWSTWHECGTKKKWSQLNGQGCFPWGLIARRIEGPRCVQEVMGSIPIRDSDFFFVPRSCHVNRYTFHISLPSLKFKCYLYSLIKYRPAEYLIDWINILTFKFVDETLVSQWMNAQRVTIQMKAIEQYFHFTLFLADIVN